MTRTARAAYPRAVIKDRSESRSGLDSSMRKSGAGHHNWGSIADEFHLESAAMEDEGLEVEEMEEEDHAEDMTASGSSRSLSPQRKPDMMSSTSSLSDEDLEKARKFRKNTFKKAGELDLSAIARTSVAISGSPPSPDSALRSKPAAAFVV